MPADCTQTGYAEHAALELFQTAALLLGDTTEAVSAVEETVAAVKVDPCAEPGAARREAERKLLERCIARARALHEDALRAPVVGERSAPVSCIETDDLSAAGLDQTDLARLLDGQGRDSMRRWLDDLHPALRIIFVIRAVLGKSSGDAAASLQAAGAGPWTPVLVGDAFREALCSLASSLVHAAVPIPATAA